jgi:hypothetical protein
MVLPRSILYQGEADFWAEVKVITPEAKVETIHYQLLRDKPVDKTKAASGVETEVVASGATGALEGGNFSVPFELSELAPGQYRFTVEAVQGGKPLGSASAPLEVIEDAFATKVHGTAGKGTGKPPETPPAAFALLATGLGAGKSEIGKEIPYLTDDMKSMPLLVWPDTASADFRSGATPRKAQLAAPIRAFAAGDEYEPVSFVVRAMRDLKTLRVEATELKGAAGAIPASQMDLRAEGPSTLLVKQESLGELPKDCVRRYFLTVYVAPGTPAGLYEGTLKFTAEGDVAEERPYSLLVLPIQLKDSSLHMGMCGEWTTGKDAERTMVQIRDALAHGMDGVECGHVFRSSLAAKANVQHIIWGLSKPTEEDSLGTGPERFKRAELDDEAFRMLKDSGMRPPIVVDLNPVVRYLPCTDENAELFEDFVRRIEAKRKEQGLPEFIYQLVDEPNDHFSMDDGRGGRRYGVALFDFFARVLHKVGVRTFITSNSGARGFDLCEGIRGQVDVWCTKVIDDPAEISRWTTDGKELWLYGYSGDGKCKGRMRSTYGFFAERVKASGVTTPAQAEMNAWNDQEKKNLNMASWEAIREGIDDSRYIAALKEAIKTAKTQAGPKAALAEQAQADLDAIVNAYPITPWQKIAFEKKHDADQWNKWRWIVASWIVKLQE